MHVVSMLVAQNFSGEWAGSGASTVWVARSVRTWAWVPLCSVTSRIYLFAVASGKVVELKTDADYKEAMKNLGMLNYICGIVRCKSLSVSYSFNPSFPLPRTRN